MKMLFVLSGKIKVNRIFRWIFCKLWQKIQIVIICESDTVKIVSNPGSLPAAPGAHDSSLILKIVLPILIILVVAVIGKWQKLKLKPKLGSSMKEWLCVFVKVLFCIM